VTDHAIAGAADNVYGLSVRDSFDKPVGSEDSLTLNVWRPSTADTKLPVIVYIHGGSSISASLDGNTRRAIDCRKGEKIDEEALETLVRAAVTLNKSEPKGDREGKRMGRRSFVTREVEDANGR
jgi:hypothetical protein